MGQLLVLSLAVSAGLGTCLHGYNSGVISHIIANPHFNNFFGTESASPILGAVVSVFSGGAVVGSAGSGFLLDTYGRRFTIQTGAVISILGVMLQASATNLTMMLIGRIVSGFAIGMMSVGVPIYLSECAYHTSRGFLTGFCQLMILMGFVASSWVGYAAHNVPNAENNAFTWRFPIAIAAIPAVFIAFALQWLPESPRFLVRQGMTEQAYKSMMKLYHDGTNREVIQRSIQEMSLQWKRECQIMPAMSDWVVMWKVPKWRARVLNAILPSVFTQLTGINIITYYQNQMFTGLGLSDRGALRFTALYHTVAPIAIIVFMLFVVDSVGRKKPMLYATPFLAMLFIIFAVLSSHNPDGTNKSASSAGIGIMFVFNIVFCMSWGPVGWTYMSEVIPLRIRGKGGALAVAVGNWTMNVLVSQISPQAMEAITWKYYIVYAVFMLIVTLPTVWYAVKEPKGMSLEAMDQLWEEPEKPATADSIHSIEMAKRRGFSSGPDTSLGGASRV
ncbi:general substrate transporter [Tricharina praecox]|uniref:general substrate transporter n=1 Tax=Tricharina praecox TaxID=43433 RepID=UPI00221EF7C8|nr:general substrate transporter [Tricharina praecox]KAI5848955.1 general substrate transporter [Tricharina praecox]